MSTKYHLKKMPVLIIGTGFSGLGAAIALKKAGIDFVILEKANEVGGTWRENTYPGCQCDIPSSVYQFSFAQKKDWSKMWAPQPEIQEYLKKVARDYNLYQHIKFGQEVERGEWNDDKNVWHIYTKDGHWFTGQFVILGLGALHIPSTPDFPGMEKFEGSLFHSAEWDSSVDLKGKRVAVVGTGASAIQIVPAVVDEVEELRLFQRTPPWVMPWTNVTMPEPAQWVLKNVPGVHRLWREYLFQLHEFVGYAMTKQPRFLKLGEMLGKWNINRHINDPELREKLTPTYSVGCKRILKDGDYYKALGNPKSDVITEGISHFTQDGIVTKDGVEHSLDVIIMATGFHVTDSYRYAKISGRYGEDLVARGDRDGAVAHRGVMFAEVPNLFMLMGPNSGLGHNSMVAMIEAQIDYALQAIRAVSNRRVQAIMPTWEAQYRYNDELQKVLDGTVWNTGCSSWYFDEHGKNRVLWKGTVGAYRRSLRKINIHEFAFIH